MRLFAWQLLAIGSVLCGLTATAQTRPQYGGTLHVSMRASPSSLDPVELAESNSIDGSSLTGLIFDTLVTIDGASRVQPALAESWQPSPGSQGLQFRLRRGVKLHDGTPFTAETAAASLRRSDPSWTVRPEGDTVTIESSAGDPEVLEELALPQNAIAKSEAGDSISGTGPFRVVNWQPGKKLTLAANEDYWAGRTFLDGIEIEIGKSYRDQMIALDSGRADLIEVAPEQMQRVSPERHRLVRSGPIELLALKFARETASAEEKKIREALRLSVERRSIFDVLLQRAGQPSGSLLPNWISGYGFVFSTDADLAAAQGLRDQVPGVPKLTIGYDANDPLARLLVERIALNAKDSGLSVQLSPAATELRLVRTPIASPDPWIAFEELLEHLGLPAVTSKSHGIEDLYAAEAEVLGSDRVIPLFHLPVAYASSGRVMGWLIQSDGRLKLTDAWLKSVQP